MTDLTTVSDEELDRLIKGWEDPPGYLQPPCEVWDGAHKEKRRREIERATKKMKPFNKEFFK